MDGPLDLECSSHFILASKSTGPGIPPWWVVVEFNVAAVPDFSSKNLKNPPQGHNDGFPTKEEKSESCILCCQWQRLASWVRWRVRCRLWQALMTRFARGAVSLECWGEMQASIDDGGSVDTGRDTFTYNLSPITILKPAAKVGVNVLGARCEMDHGVNNVLFVFGEWISSSTLHFCMHILFMVLLWHVHSTSEISVPGHTGAFNPQSKSYRARSTHNLKVPAVAFLPRISPLLYLIEVTPIKFQEPIIVTSVN